MIRSIRAKATKAATIIRTYNDPPSGLSYSDDPVVYDGDVAITPNTPTVTGDHVTYTSTPALPDDLILDSSTGIISGTPRLGSASTPYTIIASNDGGNTTCTLDIEITAADIPSAFSYSDEDAQYVEDSPITDNTPTITGIVLEYTVDPALPAGLILDAETGVISGTPTTVVAVATYTITASNSSGSAECEIDIEITAI